MGKNLASNSMAKMGDALGIIAAQSIGEPGTQLTMRTFHIGGTASASLQQSSIKTRHEGQLLYSDSPRFVEDKEGEIKVVKSGSLKVVGTDGSVLEKNELFVGGYCLQKRRRQSQER